MNSIKLCQNEKNIRHADLYSSLFIIPDANVYVFSEKTQSNQNNNNS